MELICCPETLVDYNSMLRNIPIEGRARHRGGSMVRLLQFWGLTVPPPTFIALKMEEADTSEMFVPYHNACCNGPEHS
jgi:hypothetical protein